MSVDTEEREDKAMEAVKDRLTRIFADAHPRDEVIQTVTAIHHGYDGRPIRDFVPVLVERYARQELKTP
ncbi:hypothetical protein EDD29_4611 [Actinocorallia herbida]|uniref:Uncharacterized protein n=1 Tax=Actinocorallia herbida TaxID=58109 RepID=A0A3N1D0G5_9ACTN|nr:hypothetical protein [Actinocorallia herbida]ROO87023.1 hypothetical protein EDD29_4611 [Actinocorallia herbida]